MGNTTKPGSRSTALASVVAVAASVAFLSGCGSSSSSSHPLLGGRSTSTSSASVQSAGAPPSAGISSVSEATGTAAIGKLTRRSEKNRVRAIDIVSKPYVQHGRGGPDEPITPPITAPNPCRLLSSNAAGAILGGPVTETEAPLGPTCILQARGQKRILTLSVETLTIRTQVREMKGLQRSTVDGHQAYCGRLGQSLLLVTLRGNKALDVNAPCGIAVAIAGAALPHVKA
jgi:hypothetical protein